MWVLQLKDIPEEQHTGGIVEVLGRIIAVACLWRKVRELRDREVALRQVLPTPTWTSSPDSHETMLESRATFQIPFHFYAWSKSCDNFIRSRLFCCIDSSGFYSQVVVSSPALFFLRINSSKAANLSNCASEYIEFRAGIRSRCCERGVVVPERCADLLPLVLSMTPYLKQSIIN